MGRHYDRLVGKKVVCIRPNGTAANCVVTGADWSVGITIQEEKTNRYIVCLHGPKSPLLHREPNSPERTIIQTLTRYIYDKVSKNLPVELNHLILEYHRNGIFVSGHPSAKTCAFSQ